MQQYSGGQSVTFSITIDAVTLLQLPSAFNRMLCRSCSMGLLLIKRNVLQQHELSQIFTSTVKVLKLSSSPTCISDPGRIRSLRVRATFLRCSFFQMLFPPQSSSKEIE